MSHYRELLVRQTIESLRELDHPDLASMLETLEGNPAIPDGDETTDGETGGERFETEQEDTFYNEKGVLVVENRKTGKRRRYRPNTRGYQVLLLLAHAENEYGENVSYEHITKKAGGCADKTSVQSSLSRLSSTPLVDVNPKRRPYRYSITDDGVDYLKKHGNPTKYDVPPAASFRDDTR